MKKAVFSQLEIKAWILFSLIVGFAVTIVVPRLAIERIGEVNYGLYAFIIGFSAILGFADLGLIPGLTKVLAEPVANGQTVVVRMATRQIERVISIVALILFSICLVIMKISLPQSNEEQTYLLAIFAFSAYVSALTEMRLSLLRIMGLIRFTYQIRITYLMCYLLLVFFFYAGIPIWKNLYLIFIAQFTSAVFCFLIVLVRLRLLESGWNRIAANQSRDPMEDFFTLLPAIWRISSAERFNKLLQFIVGMIERPMIVALGGVALVGSFDLMMRLMIIVSAIPGALNQPLLSMLTHDLSRKGAERKFPLALRLTRVISTVTAFVGFFIAIALFANFHERIFGVPSMVPLTVFAVIAVSTAVNVLTATGSAVFISQGIVWPNNWKVAIEGFGVIFGVALGYLFGDVYVFLICRYAFLLLAAIFLLILENKMKEITR